MCGTASKKQMTKMVVGSANGLLEKEKILFFFWQRVYIIDVSTDSLSAER